MGRGAISCGAVAVEALVGLVLEAPAALDAAQRGREPGVVVAGAARAVAPADAAAEAHGAAERRRELRRPFLNLTRHMVRSASGTALRHP